MKRYWCLWFTSNGIYFESVIGNIHPFTAAAKDPHIILMNWKEITEKEVKLFIKRKQEERMKQLTNP